MKQKQNIFFRIFKLFIWIFVIYSLFFYYNYSSFLSKELTKEDINIEVNKWETFRSLYYKFEEDVSKKYFLNYLRFNKPDFDLQAGTYNIKKGTTVETLFEQLKNPINNEKSLTFLEGWNIYDIDYYLVSKWLVKKWEFSNFAERVSVNLKNDYKFLENAISLEGFLYPDTYKININNFSPEYLAKKMLDNFEKKVYNDLLKQYSPKEIYDIINLASIVEKEEKSKSERPVVAWILKKRLNEWWMIWADITVCYPYKLTWEECKMVVSKYIWDKNEYNTRTMKWLPKTPIWSPHISSITSVMNPKQTPYYFYLHDSRGVIHYAKTNAEHELNKDTYLR